MVDIPDECEDIRCLLSIMPTITPQATHALFPLGPWDGCMLANIVSDQDSELVASLFKQWHLAIAILSIHSSVSRADTIAMLPSALLLFYHKKMFTICHEAIGGSRQHHGDSPIICGGKMLYPINCYTLQTALSDTIGAARGLPLNHKQVWIL